MNSLSSHPKIQAAYSTHTVDLPDHWDFWDLLFPRLTPSAYLVDLTYGGGGENDPHVDDCVMVIPLFDSALPVAPPHFGAKAAHYGYEPTPHTFRAIPGRRIVFVVLDAALSTPKTKIPLSGPPPVVNGCQPLTPEQIALIRNNQVAFNRVFDIGQRLYITDAAQDINHEGKTYRPANIAKIDSISAGEGTKISNFKVSGQLGGRFNSSTLYALRGAPVTMCIILTSSSARTFALGFKGKVGIIEILGGVSYTMEILSRLSASDRITTEPITSNCTLTLGSSRCGATVPKLLATISAVTDPRGSFEVTHAPISPPPLDYYLAGQVRLVDGADVGNSGLANTFTPITSTVSLVTLLHATGVEFQVGDQLEIHASCNKLFNTCKDKFNNALNFKGCRNLPGISDRFRGT